MIGTFVTLLLRDMNLNYKIGISHSNLVCQKISGRINGSKGYKKKRPRLAGSLVELDFVH